MNISETLSLKSASNITTGSNVRSNSNGSLIFEMDYNSQNSNTYNRTCLTVAIAGIIISGVFHLKFPKNQDSRRYFSLLGKFQRLIYFLTEI